jgi:hypothetical protein
MFEQAPNGLRARRRARLLSRPSINLGAKLRRKPDCGYWVLFRGRAASLFS